MKKTNVPDRHSSLEWANEVEFENYLDYSNTRRAACEDVLKNLGYSFKYMDSVHDYYEAA